MFNFECWCLVLNSGVLLRQMCVRECIKFKKCVSEFTIGVFLFVFLYCLFPVLR